MSGVAADPSVVNLLDRHDIHVVPPLPSIRPGNHEFRTFEHAQMLHDRTAVEIAEMRAEIAGRPRRAAQQIEDLAARRMPERLENTVLLVKMPNHVIKL